MAFTLVNSLHAVIHKPELLNSLSSVGEGSMRPHGLLRDYWKVPLVGKDSYPSVT